MKYFLLLLTCTLAIAGTSQTTFSVAQATPALAITANATVDIVTTASTLNERIMHIQNTTGTTKVYNLKKYALTLHANATTTAEASFAFGGCDFGPQTNISLCTLTLTAGQNSSSLGAYSSLYCHLAEASSIGYSVVKYTIYNTNQASDSLQFTLRYNNTSQVTSLADLYNASIVSLGPNPAKNFLSVCFNSNAASEANLQIIDINGKVVLLQKTSLQTGENKINVSVSQLSPGMYYLNLQNQTAVLSRKFVIE